MSIYAGIDKLPSKGIVLSISDVSNKARIELALEQEKQKIQAGAELSQTQPPQRMQFYEIE